METLQLLQKWNLLELQNKFKEHDISVRSLIYLTDEEICELVPKIGTRTIFRAMLKEWRRTCDSMAYLTPSMTSTCEIDYDDSSLDQIAVKTECNTEEIIVNDYERELKCDKHNQHKDQNLHRNSNEAQILPELLHKTIQKSQLHYKVQPFVVVLDVLNSCTDGQTVLEFYKKHNFLDLKNRKRIVNLLIRNVVERKVEKYSSVFHDITRQLLQIFPSEKYETYFVPHNGANSARGALYYKYSNYTRQLRKEGLLAYKKRKPKSNCL